jgi:ketosteroid isomerase-like protein
MSQENIETIRAGYDALSRGDHDAWISNVHPDVEWHELATNPDAAVYRGHAGVRKWIESVWEAGWGEGSRFEPEHFTEAGDFILVSVRAFMFARGSSVPVEGRLFHVYEFHQGKVRRIWAYLTEAEALEAVGLSEN